jgi:alpha-galactosidase
VCDLDAKNSIHEKIVAARGNESFDVDIIKGGLPMMDKAKATFDLKAINGSQTNVTFTMKFTSKPAFMAPLMKGMMAKMLKKMLVGLKYHLETDQLVTKGNINSIMKGYRKLHDNESFVAKGLTYA